MNCPACGRALAAGGGACAACGARPGLPVEGALAPDPAARPEHSREPAGKRRRERERHWKDEVRERMDRRRRREAGEAAQPELPLFREPAPPPPPALEPFPQASSRQSAPVAADESEPQPLEESAQPVGPTELGSEPETPPLALDQAEPDDGLSLRASDEPDRYVEPLPLRDLDAPRASPAATRPGSRCSARRPGPARTTGPWARRTGSPRRRWWTAPRCPASACRRP